MIEINADYTMEQAILTRKQNEMELARKNDTKGTRYKIRFKEIRQINESENKTNVLELDNKEWRKTQNVSDPDKLIGDTVQINLPDMNLYAIFEIKDILRTDSIEVHNEKNIKRCGSCGLLNEKTVTIRNNDNEILLCPICLGKLNTKITSMLNKISSINTEENDDV